MVSVFQVLEDDVIGLEDGDVVDMSVCECDEQYKLVTGLGINGKDLALS